MADQPADDGGDPPVVARSFLVRALLEDGPWRWHGFVTDVETGARREWRRPGDVARFVDRQLAAVGAGLVGTAPALPRFLLGPPDIVGPRGLPGPHDLSAPPFFAGLTMASPTLTDVVTDMLAVLAARLPATPPAVPDANVTLEQVTEKTVGLGEHIGTQQSGAMGESTLRGGRLDARVRFQLWAPSPGDVDAAMLSLHETLLDDSQALYTAGFLKFSAADTTLAEPVTTIPAWRKTSSYAVLYEYRYTADDDAAGLIARIPVTTDHGDESAPTTETQTLTDALVRWDEEGAGPLVVRGPRTVSHVSALAWVPGPALGGTVTFHRAGAAGAPTVFPDLDTFLAATTGAEPTHTDAEVTLAPAAALAALGPPVPGPSLGDWDTDGTVDAYTGTDRRLDAPIVLASAADRFEIRYTPPAGPVPGLDQTAVVYLRVGRP
ncbi:MAG: hypothetical protein ACYC1Z_04890 [Georgenia sp.]